MSSQCVSATLCHSASLATSLSKVAAHTSWCDGTEPVPLVLFSPSEDPWDVVRHSCVRIYFFEQKMQIFLNTSIAIDSDGLKVIWTCVFLCVELLSGRHTSKQCNGISWQCNTDFKSSPFEVLIDSIYIDSISPTVHKAVTVLNINCALSFSLVL